MASIDKMSHKSVTATFTMEDWELIKAVLKSEAEPGTTSEAELTERYPRVKQLLGKIAPAPWRSRSPLGKKK